MKTLTYTLLLLGLSFSGNAYAAEKADKQACLQAKSIIKSQDPIFGKHLSCQNQYRTVKYWACVSDTVLKGQSAVSALGQCTDKGTG